MKRLRFLVAWLVCAAWLAACTTVPPLPPADPGPPERSVSVVSNGWHAAIVVARADVAATGRLPEAEDFPTATFLEFGWGDRTYYPAPRKTLGMALGALLADTPAVMHLAGLSRAPERTYARAEIVKIAMTEGGLRRLVGALADTFDRADGSRARPVSRGLYVDSNFYNARGQFNLFNTCNTWAARMLRTAGIDVSPSGVITADDLMERLRALLARGGTRGS